MPAGRPSKFKKEYCQQLIDHMSMGLSYQSFAGKVGVSVDCLYRWEKRSKQFYDARKLGTEKCRLQWEKMGLAMAAGKLQGNPTVWIFNMKNRFGWRDKQPEEVREEQAARVKSVQDVQALIEAAKKEKAKK